MSLGMCIQLHSEGMGLKYLSVNGMPMWANRFPNSAEGSTEQVQVEPVRSR